MHSFLPLSTLLWASTISNLPTTFSSPVQSCKSRPGDSNWPSASEWQALNRSVSGNLIKSNPPGAVCHPSSELYDNSSCTTLQSSWDDADWHAKNPVSIDYNDNSCPVRSPDAPCSGKGYPAYVINATSAEYVQAAVNFARERNVRLSIKGTGHDFPGRSAGPGSLSIWTHHMQGLEYNRDDVLATKYGAVGSVKINAGMRWHEIYKFANESGITLVGGGDGRVGIGGWSLGAGHGPLTSQFGLGADQILSMDVVTADGKLRTVNETHEPDLFWALRGGGGSTFAAVVSFTVKAYAQTSIGYCSFALNTTANSDSFWSLLAYFHSQIPDLMDAGLQGYYYPEPYAFTNYNLSAPEYGTIWGILHAPNKTEAEVRDILAPLEVSLNSSTLPGGVQVRHTCGSIPTFYDYSLFSAYGKVGYDARLGSRLLDRQALTGDLDRAASLLRKALPAKRGFITTGQMTTPVLADDNQIPAGGNAVLPAWRKAYVHLDFTAIWGENGTALDHARKAAATEHLRNVQVPALVELAPGTGAYMSEADPSTEDWQRTFWGDNYPTLLEIKKKWDPEGVFWCVPCVGHELWEIVGGDGIGQDGAKVCRR